MVEGQRADMQGVRVSAWRWLLCAAAGYGVLAVAVFGDVLLWSDGLIASHAKLDVYNYFASARAFGFAELGHGNLPLWNPYVFCGTPFVGGFQSAMFYPPNLLYLFLPLHDAINVNLMLHVFLAGIFMYGWARFRGLRPLAAFYAGAVLMFSGAYFMHVIAGHITLLEASSWAPLTFLAVERILRHGSWRWALVGVFSVSMQILAGYPPTVFYMAVAVGLYSLLCLIKTDARGRKVLLLGSMAVVPVVICAVQLWVGYDTAVEGTRAEGLQYDAAVSFSFPPENFLTLLAPGLFGGFQGMGYWGVWFYWEMNVFVGITGLSMALVGAVWGGREGRRFAVLLVCFFCVLALGQYTPVYAYVYRYVPGAAFFRSPSKMMYFATMFGALLAGCGMQFLLGSPRRTRWVGMGVLALGAVPLAGIAWIRLALSPDPISGAWGQMMTVMRRSVGNQNPFTDAIYESAARFAMLGLAVALICCLVLAALLFSVRRWPRMAYVVLAFGVLEVFVFACVNRRAFPASTLENPHYRALLEEHPGDYRVYGSVKNNHGTHLRMHTVRGYDPVRVSRFTELMKHFDSEKRKDGGGTAISEGLARLYRLLRVRYLSLDPERPEALTELDGAFPRLSIVHGYMLETKPTAIFRGIANPEVSLRETVFLERAPTPAPDPLGVGGSVVIVDESTDHLTIAAEVAAPALLLVTDAYSRYWRAIAMPGSAQTEYEVLPANYAFRAVPLEAGKHLFRMEYAPPGYRYGRWVSVVGIIGYLVAVCVALVPKRGSFYLFSGK